MAQGERKKRRLDKKVATLIAAGTGLFVLAASGLVIAGVNQGKSQEDNQATVSLSETKLTSDDNNTYISTDETTVEILMEDYAVPIGTTIQVTALVTPENTDKALVWSTDNTDVLEVTQDGIVTIKGTGTAVLTATVGTVSDAIILEGISSINAASVNNLPIYTGATLSTSSGSSSGSASTGSSSSSSSGQTSYTYTSEADSSDSDSDSTDDGSDDGSSDESDDGASDSYDGGSGSSGSSSSGGSESTALASVLPGMGFTHTVSNVYVYNEGDTYCGEIITQPNVAIIYIKTRTTGFDSIVQSVIESLIPGSSNQIWNNYLSASTDRTFTVDDRKVRIVTGINGGHSQIVIYNS